MKIALVGANRPKLLGLLEPFPGVFSVVETDPEYVISYGGDGTLLQAEHLFPGIPKINLKDSEVAKLAENRSNREVLQRFVDGVFVLEQLIKLEASFNGQTIVGLNDIVITNENPRHAIRYKVFVRGSQVGDRVIGDGVVVATPFGSTGYYRSITDSIFETGIGIAFNNSTEQADHMVVGEDAGIMIDIVRGPAFCYADNQPGTIALVAGDRLTIKKAIEHACIVRTAPVYVWQAGSRIANT